MKANENIHSMVADKKMGKIISNWYLIISGLFHYFGVHHIAIDPTSKIIFTSVYFPTFFLAGFPSSIHISGIYNFFISKLLDQCLAFTWAIISLMVPFYVAFFIFWWWLLHWAAVLFLPIFSDNRLNICFPFREDLYRSL